MYLVDGLIRKRVLIVRWRNGRRTVKALIEQVSVITGSNPVLTTKQLIKKWKNKKTKRKNK
jgi:hypothetical protein